jgi:Cyclic nucleotide-binding domain.
MYFLIEGEVGVSWIPEDEFFLDLTEGETFGEICLLSDKKSSYNYV